MKGLAAGYERFARIILMVFVTNVAFVAHTALGGVIIGFFPSVSATATIFRTWLLTGAGSRSWTVRQTWTLFHQAWRADIGGANAFGWPQLGVWALLVWDYYLVNWNDTGLIGLGVSGVLLLANVLYGVFVLISWTVRANFNERPWWIVRTSLRMVLARPMCSFSTMALSLLTAWVWSNWPGLLVTFGFALPMLGVVIAVYSFARLPGMSPSGAESRSTPRAEALRSS